MNAPKSVLSPYYEILAVPCNQFELQEPGKNYELLAGLKYVRPGNQFVPNFNLTAKTEVNGENEEPLYTFLKGSCPQTTDSFGDTKDLFWTPLKTSDITWNFEKFLIDAKGRPRYRFHPSVTPTEVVPFAMDLVEEEYPQHGLGNITSILEMLG